MRDVVYRTLSGNRKSEVRLRIVDEEGRAVY